jgi:hypothetical protein
MRPWLALWLLALLLPAQAVVLAFKDAPGTRRLYMGDLQETVNTYARDAVGPAYLVYRSERVQALEDGTAALVWEQRLQRKDTGARTDQPLIEFTRTPQGKIAVTPTGVPGEPEKPYVRFDTQGMTLAFPTRDLQPSDTWSVKGKAAFDGFKVFMLTGDFVLDCRLESVKTIGKYTYAQIAATYTLTCEKQQPESGVNNLVFSQCSAVEKVSSNIIFNATTGEVTGLTFKTEIAKTTYDDQDKPSITVTKLFGSLKK